MGPPKILKPEGGDWANAFNPEIFKKKVAELKEAAPTSVPSGPPLDLLEASKKTDEQIAELKKGVLEASKKTDEQIADFKKAGTVTDKSKEIKAGPSKKIDLKNPNFQSADESIAAIMKMVEDEKENDELKRAQEEVESYRYPNETVAEFEKNIVFRHNDSHTQWISEFAKKRGWFVQCAEANGQELGGRHRAVHTITIKHVVVQGFASKKKDAKKLAYQNMSTRLGEVFKKLKPQPGTDLLELNKVIEKMRDHDPSDDRRRDRSRSLRRARSRSAQRRRSDHAEARRRRSSSRGRRRSRSRTRRNSRRSSSRKRSRSSRRKSKSRSPSKRKNRSKSKTKRRSRSRSRSKTIKKERRSRSRSTPITVGKSYWDA